MKEKENLKEKFEMIVNLIGEIDFEHMEENVNKLMEIIEKNYNDIPDNQNS